MKICMDEIWEDLGWCPLDSAFIKLRELRGIFFWRDKSSSSDLKQPPNLPSSSKEHSTECLVTLSDTFAGILTASPFPLNVDLHDSIDTSTINQNWMEVKRRKNTKDVVLEKCPK